MLIFFKLVKAEYGTLREVQNFNAREVIQALYYETFLSEYESTYLELNK